MDLKALEAGYTPIDLGGGQQPQGKPQKKKKNFWLDQISTLTGTVGGIGGGLLGAAAGGVGAVPGAVVGGAGGSALGEAIENALTGTRTLDNVGKEAVLGGVFAGGPLKIAGAGGRAVLGAGAKTATTTAGKTIGSTLAKEAGQTVIDTGVRTAGERGTQRLLGGALGIKTGAKAGGEVLTPQKARTLQQFVTKEVGIPRTASSDMAAERLVNFQKLTGQNIDDVIKTGDRTLSPQEISGLNTKFSERLSKIAGVDPQSPGVQRLLQQAQEPKSVSELVKFRRSLDDAINYNRNIASPDPLIERTAKVLRGEIDDFTSKAIPGLKNFNQQYSKASQALEHVLPNAKNPKGIKVPFVGVNVGGTLGQRAKSLTGQLSAGLPTVGRETGEEATRRLGAGSIQRQMPSTLRGLGGITNKGITSRMIGGNLLAGNSAQPEEPQSLEDALLQFESSGGQEQAIEETQVEQSPYSRENLIADMQRDPENADKYLEYYAQLQEVYGTQQSQPKLNNTAIQSITDLQTGIDNLGSLEERFASSNANQPFIGGLRSKNPFDTESKSLRAETDRVKQVVGKALEGGVLRKEDEEKYARILPTVNDTDEVARRKIAAIRGDLQNKLRTFYSNQIQFSGGGNTLEDAIMSAQSAGVYR